MSSREQWFRSIVSGQRRGPTAFAVRLLLRGASVPYALAMRLRNRRYDRDPARTVRVNIPVVSVGNLTLGGTGKTPCVELVAGMLRDDDFTVAILSRGYGSTGGVNDEAMLLEDNLPDVPHLQGADRTMLARTAMIELESEVLILDDGFQHRRLGRDLDIVLIDATEPWGYGRVFPAGMLREPRRGLGRANLIVLTRSDRVRPEVLASLEDEVRTLAGATILRSVHKPTMLVSGDEVESPTVLNGQEVASFCGIADPANFRATVRGLGAEIVGEMVFADHHAYTREDVDRLRAWAAGFPEHVKIVTTQKDIVKLRLADLAGRGLWYIRIGMSMNRADTETLRNRLRQMMNETADTGEWPSTDD